ncbi:Uncharacterised protein [uncultured archaeon]|nr:Uncharacterised protein [uncultured archaeon]
MKSNFFVGMVRKTLEDKGYYVTREYGLILKTKESEEVIADVRYKEEKVVLPYWNGKESKEVSKLRRILLQETIRDCPRKD